MSFQIFPGAGAALQLRRAQWLSPQQLGDLQWRRLRLTLQHAARNSPFYRRRFEEAGVGPDDIRSPEDLTLLPITTRADLRDGERLVTDGHDPKQMLRSLTSGSTGRRTVTYFDRRAWWIGKYLLKGRARAACGVGLRDRIALFQESSSNTAARRIFGRQRSFSIHVPPEQILQDVRGYAPTVLYSFPSYLIHLAERSNGSIRPRLIFTSGEFLDAATRRKIEQAFAAPVLDVYGCTEVKEIAWECPKGRGYHINADWLVVESVPLEENGQTRPDTLLVTTLYNRGMPLVRYRLGDTGKLLDGPCECGRGLPLMAPSLGRQVDYLVLPDGSEVSPYTLTCAIERIPGMLQYQIVQNTPGQVVVHVVPTPELGRNERGEIARSLTSVLPGVEVEVREVDGIEREPSGKLRVVMSQVQRVAQAAW